MIAAWGLLLLMAVWGPGWLPGIAALCVAMHVFLYNVLPALSAGQYLVLTVFVLAVPAAAFLAGALLDTFALSAVRARDFSTLAVVMAFCLVFESDRFLDYFAAAVVMVQEANWAKLLYLFGAALNALMLCGGLLALVIMALHLSFEIPVLWLTKASRTRVYYAFAAMRPLSIVVAVTLLLNLIVELFAANLWPPAIKG